MKTVCEAFFCSSSIFAELLSLRNELSVWSVRFRVIRHGNGGAGQKVVGLAEEGAGGCLLIL